jgi:vacuolar protein sorting-associated protein 51
MSTIATPRIDPSTPLPRRTSSYQPPPPPQPPTITPVSSNRPSLDSPRSGTGSPNPNNAGPQGSGGATGKRNNRAALREYYNLKKTPLVEVTDTDSNTGEDPTAAYSEVPQSELDVDGFDADAYVRRQLEASSLEELLRTYTRVLGEIRALDAEKKALVYDNYSKLITATETIRKVRMAHNGSV